MSYLELPPDATIETVLERLRAKPERLAVFAFFAAKIVQRDKLDYFATFNRVLGLAMGAGIDENEARCRVYRGFGAAAAKHDKPPVGLVLDVLEVAA
jgi:hypothetical protein